MFRPFAVKSNTVFIVDVRLELIADSWCEETSVLHVIDHDNSGYYDNCKEWCARSSECGGFSVQNGNCVFNKCDYVQFFPGSATFLKIIT